MYKLEASRSLALPSCKLWGRSTLNMEAMTVEGKSVLYDT